MRVRYLGVAMALLVGMGCGDEDKTFSLGTLEGYYEITPACRVKVAGSKVSLQCQEERDDWWGWESRAWDLDATVNDEEATGTLTYTIDFYDDWGGCICEAVYSGTATKRSGEKSTGPFAVFAGTWYGTGTVVATCRDRSVDQGCYYDTKPSTKAYSGDATVDGTSAAIDLRGPSGSSSVFVSAFDNGDLQIQGNVPGGYQRVLKR